MFRTWLGRLVHRNRRYARGVRRGAGRRTFPFQPTIEVLEDRLVMTSQTAINAIVADYAGLGGSSGFLGQAVGSYLDTADGGSYHQYQGGWIYWSANTGAHEIGGAIYAKWQQVGGVSFGYPSTDETAAPDRVSRYNHFELVSFVAGLRGLTTITIPKAIDLTEQFGAHVVQGAIAVEFAKLGWEQSPLGCATTDQSVTGKGDGLFSFFQNDGAILYSQATGAHEVHGAIRDDYARLGWEQSPLGYPTTDQALTGKGDGDFNFFQNGAILYSQATGAHDVYGAIRDEYAKLGWEKSVLGYPTTDESVTGKGDGLFSFFQNDGAILYSQATGAHEVHGPIRDDYANLGWEKSPLGYPTIDQTITGKGDGNFNFFQNGAILYSQATGAHDVYGAIRDEYARLGWEQSVLGYPTTDEAVTGKGDGLFNFFQNDGAILYGPATGAHEVHGAIRDDYANLGWEKSPLGYPTIDQTVTGKGNGNFNFFQNGAILYSQATGAHDVYGGVRDEYAKLGWEQSPMGYPISDQQNGTGAGDQLGVFENGAIQVEPSATDIRQPFILDVYKLFNSPVPGITTLRFTWENPGNLPFDGFLIRYGLTGNAAAETQVEVDAPGGSGSYDVSGFGFLVPWSDPLKPGSTYTFSVDPFFNNPPSTVLDAVISGGLSLFIYGGNYYANWTDPIHYTLT